MCVFLFGCWQIVTRSGVFSASQCELYHITHLGVKGALKKTGGFSMKNESSHRATVGEDERLAAGRSRLGPSARQLARTDFAALRLCRPAASIRVAPGVAPVATRQPIERDKTFPSAECVSSSETAEATGDPCAPLARLSAPPGHGRLAPPLRDSLRPLNEAASKGTHVRSREQGERGERRAEPRRVFRGPTGLATRRFASVIAGGSERCVRDSPR